MRGQIDEYHSLWVPPQTADHSSPPWGHEYSAFQISRFHSRVGTPERIISRRGPTAHHDRDRCSTPASRPG
jgi:hypothetical protein